MEHQKSFLACHKNIYLVLQDTTMLHAALRQVSVYLVIVWETGKKNQGDTPKSGEYTPKSQSIIISLLTNSHFP